MKKKDFIKLADYLRGEDIPDPVLDAIVDFCKASNSRFMADRWIGYLKGECGPNGGAIKK